MMELVRVSCLVFVVSVLLGVAGAWGTFTVDRKYLATTDVPYEYGLMLDAGSSGTRVHVYVWPKRTNNSIPMVATAPIGEVPYSMKVAPGLSAFQNSPQDAGASLIPLLQYAQQCVPEKQWRITPVYLKATAGMRLLNESSQEAILESCRKTLASFPFLFLPRWASVISGQQEGIYGWITANYLLDTLTKADPMKTVGTLDLGGASTQIVFVPSSPAPAPWGVTITLGGVQYPLYVWSYLGYGNDQARYRKNETVVAHNGFMPVTNDGCLPIGYNTSFALGQSIYTLNGISKFSTCISEARQLFNKDATCAVPPCSFDGVFQPKVRGAFVAFSAYVYMTEFFNLSANSSIIEIANAGQQFCRLNWTELEQQYQFSPDWSYINTYCFLNTYVCSLLHYGFGFEIDAHDIAYVDSINNVDLGWALGAMLAEADLLPYWINLPGGPPPPPPSRSTQ